MKKTDTRVLNRRMPDLRQSLVYMTGVDHGADPAKWAAWWSENRKTFELPAQPPKMTGTARASWRNFWGDAREYERRKKRGDRG